MIWKSLLISLKVRIEAGGLSLICLFLLGSINFLALIDDGFQTHKCIYNIAFANYKLGKLRQSRLYCERLLKLDPMNQQAQALHQQLDSIVQQSM